MRYTLPFRKTIVSRLILSLLVASSLVTLVLTALQLFDDYRYEMTRVEKDFELMERGSFDSLTRAIWNFDTSQIQTIMMGFTVVPHISYVELDVATGEHYVAGQKPSTSQPRRDIRLFHERSRPEPLATLHFYLSTQSIYQRLFSKVLMLLMANALKTLIVCSVMVVVIHRSITRHLLALVAEVKQLSSGDWKLPASAADGEQSAPDDVDEIGLLRQQFSAMRAHLRTAFVQRERYLGELEESKRVIEAANKAKNAFLANMSHELRTPLNAVIGFSELLTLEKKTFGLRDDVVSMVQRIFMAGTHLLRLIGDLLDISMIEGGRVKIQKANCNIGLIIHEALAFQETTIKERRLEVNFEIDTGLSVESDGVRLRQIVNNLLANAVKFTPHGGHIMLSTLVQDDEMQILVTDSGIGIAPEHQKLIFEEFRQVDDGVTRRYDGVGLGLTISRRLIEILGGRIWVESSPGKGSTFGIGLPIKAKTIGLASSPPEL